VRQVEIGLAALFNVLFGSTLAALSIAILSSSRYPQWLGAGGLVVALAIVAAGAATAFAGFSAVPMTIVMLATLMFLVWLVAAAILMWRLAPQLSRTAEAGEANTR
jgi:hypothetical protein